MQESTAITALAALAQPGRLRLFRALVGAGLAGSTPGALSAALGMPTSTLSFHLKGLMHAGLVSQERAGRNRIYRVAMDQMSALLDYLTAHCCQHPPTHPQDAGAAMACCPFPLSPTALATPTQPTPP
jgi:ArsR family transcriptional regulator, arsenate/arsenite/antimonite-responsive transcriptional repressor